MVSTSFQHPNFGKKCFVPYTFIILNILKMYRSDRENWKRWEKYINKMKIFSFHPYFQNRFFSSFLCFFSFIEKRFQEKDNIPFVNGQNKKSWRTMWVLFLKWDNLQDNPLLSRTMMWKNRGAVSSMANMAILPGRVVWSLYWLSV